jgi:2-polyprenyl-3-methyl-5-hydroxy-6-metoxy-1,4-benzoquinol methylase
MIIRSKKDLVDHFIHPNDIVLDIGYSDTASRLHELIKARAKDVYGLDLYTPQQYKNNDHYIEASCENFSIPIQFDTIFAGDLIEHISNPGLFLQCCKKHIKPGGRLILTTPNAFSLFSIVEKVTHQEPNVHTDHTLYLNKPTIGMLLQKNGWQAERFDTMDDKLEDLWKGGLKRKLMATIYTFLSNFTEKYMITMIVTAKVT